MGWGKNCGGLAPMLAVVLKLVASIQYIGSSTKARIRTVLMLTTLI